MLAIATLALGIGANTALFSIVDAVLLKPLPYRDPSRIFMVSAVPPPTLGIPSMPWGETPVYELSRAPSFEATAAFQSGFFNLELDGQPQRIDGIKTSAGLFDVLGVQAEIGRVFTAVEDVPGNTRFVVLSDSLWRTRFRADPEIAGRLVRINGAPHVVLGVMKPDFHFPLGAEMPGNLQFPAKPDLWVPLGLPATPRRGLAELLLIAKLRPDRTKLTAQADLNEIRQRLEHQDPRWKGWIIARLTPLAEQSLAASAREIEILMGAVGFLLLIACSNVSNLILARSTYRAREFSIRNAIGASVGRLVRQLATESLVIALAGAAGGILFAGEVLRIAILLAADRVPRIATAAIDFKVLLFALLIAGASALICSVAPVLKFRGLDFDESLRSAGRSSFGRSSRRTQSALVIAEVMLSVVLLAGAGLLIRTFTTLLRQDPGFRAQQNLTFEVTLPAASYRDYSSRRNAYNRFLDRLYTTPGISLAAAGNLPLTEEQDSTVFSTEDGPPVPSEQRPLTEYLITSRDYFRVLGIPLLAGRWLRATDTESAPLVAIITKSMADRAWPGRDAIGKRFRYQPGFPWVTVVGIVPEVKLYSLGEGPRMAMFVPLDQHPYPAMTTMQFIVRTPLSDADAGRAISSALRGVDSSLPVAKLRPLGSIVDESMQDTRFAMLLLAAFAVFGLILAAAGVYGMLAHHVALQTREIGLRMAIGATRKDILMIIAARGMKLVTIGTAAGCMTAILLARVMQSLVSGVTTYDPLTYLLAFAVMLGCAALGCYFPARAAMKIEPLEALRGD